MKQAGISFPEPTNKASDNQTTYCVITGYLVAALRGQEEFSTADHAAYMREERAEVQKRNKLRSEESMEETLEGSPAHEARHLWQETKTGSWMTE